MGIWHQESRQLAKEPAELHARSRQKTMKMIQDSIHYLRVGVEPTGGCWAQPCSGKV